MHLYAWRRRGRVFTCAFAFLTAIALTPGSASAATKSSLAITASGLPSGQSPSIVATGPKGFLRKVKSRRATFRNLRPGRYVLRAKPVVLSNGGKGVADGATAYAAQESITLKIAAGSAKKVKVVYSDIVNPGVRPLPESASKVIGDPTNPKAILLPAKKRKPPIGTVFTSGPTQMLPAGLVSKVTRATRADKWIVVWLEPVSITEATPRIGYEGELPLNPAGGAVSNVETGDEVQPDGAPSARSAAACGPPKLLKFGARLDKVELREASLGAWPPQMRLTLAIRTTESLGIAAAAAGINCDWELGNLGPYQAAIPVGPVVVPVFAQIPVRAGIRLNGRLEAAAVNVASTTVATIAAGAKQNTASLSQQGTNVWVSGVLSLNGSAKLYASVGVQAGIGVVKGANVNLEASFGPEFNWSSGQKCNLQYNFGSLRAGVEAFGKEFKTPAFTPFKINIWSGCDPTTPPPTTPPPTTPQTWTEQQGTLGANTFTNPNNASGMGVKIQPYQSVQVTCKVYAPQIQSANPDGYWYKIASAPWNNQYYAVANTFWNGDIPGQKPYTRNTDWAVPNC